ncbi:MAG: hypothetical protein WCT05_09660 [Lentisphaeria bacterium]
MISVRLLHQPLRNILILISMGMLLLSGCRSLQLPPGIQKENGSFKSTFPNEASTEAKYAVLTWFLNTRDADSLAPGLQTYIRDLQKQAVDSSNQKLAEKLAEQAGALARLDAGGGLRFDPTVFAEDTDWMTVFNKLGFLREALKSPVSANPTETEINQIFASKQKDDAAEFRVWINANPLSIPESGILHRQELLKNLDHIQDVIALKRRLLDSLSEATALLESGNGTKALNLLDEIRKNLSESSSLSLIGDVKTLAAFERTRSELPAKIINTSLLPLEKILYQEIGKQQALEENATSQSQLKEMERKFSEFLQTWQLDMRFQTSINENMERLIQFTSAAAETRSRLWTKRIEKLADQSEFWNAALEFQACRQQLSEAAAAEFSLYFKLKPAETTIENFGKIIETALCNKFLTILPGAFKEYLAAAEHAAHVTNKHGICLTLCKMLQVLTDLAGGETALPTELAGNLPQIQEFVEVSLQRLKKEGLLRSIVINEMSSGIPGLGMTYARDLENILRSMLNIPGLAPLVQVAESQVPPSTQDYVIYGGIIADYDGSELVERSTMRSVIRHDEIQKISNPDFNPEAPTSAAARLTAKFLYRQNEIEQIITVKEIERLAHLRIFFNLKGPGVADLLELNEFYSRKFALEQSHLINDVHKKRVIETYDSANLTVPEAPPTLLNDRIWSTGEMLDFARKDSLKIFALKILYQLQYFPLFLAQRAEKLGQEGEAQEAAEFWGRCEAVCEQLNVVSEINTLLNFEQTPAALCYNNDLKKLQLRQLELQKLKKCALPEAFAQTCIYLQKKRSAK